MPGADRNEVMRWPKKKGAAEAAPSFCYESPRDQNTCCRPIANALTSLPFCTGNVAVVAKLQVA